MENRYSVYGGFGFVGGEFCRQYSQEVIRVPKHEQESPSNKILYFISTTDNYGVYDDPLLDIETNVVWFMQVLSKAHVKYKDKFEFTLVSTWFTYGSTPSSSEHPHVEEAYCDPKGFYSITARCREQLLISYCETFGIKYKILRLANVIGAKDRKVSKKKNALQYLFDKIVHDEPVELYDNGEFYRDYIDVRDVARAIKLAMESPLPYTIYNISNGVSHKFIDLIKFAIEYAQSKTTVWDKLDKPEFHKVVQSKNVFLSNKKLEETGYKPAYTIWQSIQDIIDDYTR